MRRQRPFTPVELHYSNNICQFSPFLSMIRAEDGDAWKTVLRSSNTTMRRRILHPSKNLLILHSSSSPMVRGRFDCVNQIHEMTNPKEVYELFRWVFNMCSSVIEKQLLRRNICLIVSFQRHLLVLQKSGKRATIAEGICVSFYFHINPCLYIRIMLMIFPHFSHTFLRIMSRRLKRKINEQVKRVFQMEVELGVSYLILN